MEGHAEIISLIIERGGDMGIKSGVRSYTSDSSVIPVLPALSTIITYLYSSKLGRHDCFNLCQRRRERGVY